MELPRFQSFNIRAFLVGLGVFVLIVLAAFQITRRQLGRNQSTSPSPTPPTAGFDLSTPAPNATPPASPQANLLGTSTSQPQTGSETVEIKNIGIKIDSPASNQRIKSPLQVLGKANVMDGLVLILVRDANQNVLGAGSAQACLDVDACPFSANVTFTSPTTPTGVIEVFNPSKSTGFQDYLNVIPVQF